MTRRVKRRIRTVARLFRLVSITVVVVTLVSAPIKLCSDASVVTTAVNTPKLLETTTDEVPAIVPIVDEPEVSEPEKSVPYYTVNGAFLGYELSDYLYEQLESRGIEWFYEYALCQLYQESRFKADATSHDGYDQGIAQLRVVYWDYFMEISGIDEADPYDPYDNLYIYTYLMNKYLRAVDGDILYALSYYNVGNTHWYNEKYANAVMQWYDIIEAK